MSRPLPSDRRFTLADAAILVAASALAFALARQASVAQAMRPFQLVNGAADAALFRILLHSTPILIASSLALVMMAVRGPRSPRRTLAGSPGFVLNAAASFGVVLYSLHMLGRVLANPLRADGLFVYVLSAGMPGTVGFFVLGALVPLAISRRFLPRPIWTDRLGWLIASLWVVSLLLSWTRLYLTLAR